MSSWLKKSNSDLILYHTSDLPYVIKDDFVLICDNNMFSETEYKTRNYIGFAVKQKLAKRLTTFYWRLEEFPIKISTNKVLHVFNENKIRHQNRDHKKIATFKDCYVKYLNAENIENILDSYDKTYLLSKNSTSNTQILEIGDMFDDHFYYGNSWYTAIVNILDKICISSYRGKNWLDNIPSMTLDVYGIKDFTETDSIRKVLEELDITDKIDFVIK
jgi:hypothetical protein